MLNGTGLSRTVPDHHGPTLTLTLALALTLLTLEPFGRCFRRPQLNNAKESDILLHRGAA